MKVKKLLKKIRKHKFQNGTTFYIEEHGEVDKETWKHLALHYPTAASISARANRNMDE